MKFATKVFTIIGGVSVLTYSGIKLRNNYNMQQQLDHRPGIFTSEGNKNSNLHGRFSQGLFTGNSNTDINCNGSDQLEIIGNRNMKADIIKSSVKAIDQSNCKLFATASNIQMQADRNSNIKADGVWCMFENNLNLRFDGEGGANSLSKFIGNQNGEFKGKDNKIVAINNRNVHVSGDGNCLEISETRNHAVRPASIGSNKNSFMIRSSGSNSVQFTVEYVETAVIVDGMYHLGIFDFDIVENGKQVDVTLHNANDVTYSIGDTTVSSVVILAEKNGVVQTLELKGDRITAVSLNSFHIYV